MQTGNAPSQRPFDIALALALVCVGLLVGLVYWPGLAGGYVFDDYPNIVDNTTLHVTAQSNWTQWLAAAFSSPSSDLQRPLAMLSFAINHAISGLDPYWMKVTNVGVHLTNTGLVFMVSWRLLELARGRGAATAMPDPARVALWVSAAWALNPINLMGVLFVVQRMESLSHTFVFAGLWLYLRGRTRMMATGHGWSLALGGLIAGTGVGVLVKESAVLLPLYALAIEWALLSFTVNSKPLDRKLLGFYVAALVVPMLAGLTWLLPEALSGQSFAGRDFSLAERLLTEARVVIDYLHWTLLPNLGQLSLYHDDYTISRGLFSPPVTALAIALLGALVGAMVLLRGRRPLMALGLAWFLAAQALTATIIPLELVFEHRNYFASLGLCLVLADGLLIAAGGTQFRRAAAAIAISVLVLYAGLTSLRAREWNSPLVFSLTEAAKHPQSPRATYDLARNFIILTDYQRDSPFLDKADEALRRAMAVPDARALPEIAAIMLALRTHRPVKTYWWASLKDKLAKRPIGPAETSALASLVDCELQKLCQLPQQQMIEVFLAALTRGPHAEILSIYGNYALNSLGDFNLTVRLWEQAAELAPREAEYQVSLAKLWVAAGQPERAAPHIARIRSLGRLGQYEQRAREVESLRSSH